MFCFSCQAQVVAGWKYCKYCGAQIVTQTMPLDSCSPATSASDRQNAETSPQIKVSEPTPPAQVHPWKLVSITGIAAVLVLVTGILVSNIPKPTNPSKPVHISLKMETPATGPGSSQALESKPIDSPNTGEVSEKPGTQKAVTAELGGQSSNSSRTPYRATEQNLYECATDWNAKCTDPSTSISSSKTFGLSASALVTRLIEAGICTKYVYAQSTDPGNTYFCSALDAASGTWIKVTTGPDTDIFGEVGISNRIPPNLGAVGDGWAATFSEHYQDVETVMSRVALQLGGRTYKGGAK